LAVRRLPPSPFRFMTAKNPNSCLYARCICSLSQSSCAAGTTNESWMGRTAVPLFNPTVKILWQIADSLLCIRRPIARASLCDPSRRYSYAFAQHSLQLGRINCMNSSLRLLSATDIAIMVVSISLSEACRDGSRSAAAAVGAPTCRFRNRDRLPPLSVPQNVPWLLCVEDSQLPPVP